VRPRHRADLARVEALIQEVATVVGATVDAGGELVIPAADLALLHHAGARLAAAGVPIAELGLRLPSLDDVFLTLTGRTAGDAPDQTEEAAA
jgi:oleandomycin transport system ATP-binding protein